MSSRTRLSKLVKGLKWVELGGDIRQDPGILDIRDRRGRNWLHLACSVDVEERGLDPVDSVRTADVLLDAGMNINEAAFSEGDWKATPLWFAVAFGNNITLAKHLLEHGPGPDHCLWAAVNRDNADVIRLLVRNGANDPTNEEGSPLLASIDWNKPAAAEALVVCSLITRAEAAEVLSKPELSKAQAISVDEEDCGYPGSGFDVHTELLKSVPGWSSWRNGLIKEGKAESVEGIGDEAAFAKDGNGDWLIVARKGDRIVTVTMYASEGSAEQLKPKLTRLVTLAVAKLR